MSAIVDQNLQFYTAINTVHCWDLTEKNHVVSICIYIYIAFYFLLKHCIDGPLLVINYRNMKLFLNKGSCVLTDSKQYVYKQCTNRTEVLHSVYHSAFNVLNILRGIGYTGCPRRKGPNFGRVFLRSNYTDITQNTYIQSSMVTEILNIEK